VAKDTAQSAQYGLFLKDSMQKKLGGNSQNFLSRIFKIFGTFLD